MPRALPFITALGSHPEPPGRNASHTQNNTKSFSLDFITDCNTLIANSNMRLGEKIKRLRELEGGLRGLDREMTQQEVVRAIRKELKQSISQSYLSQIE